MFLFPRRTLVKYSKITTRNFFALSNGILATSDSMCIERIDLRRRMGMLDESVVEDVELLVNSSRCAEIIQIEQVQDVSFCYLPSFARNVWIIRLTRLVQVVYKTEFTFCGLVTKLTIYRVYTKQLKITNPEKFSELTDAYNIHIPSSFWSKKLKYITRMLWHSSLKG